MVKTFLKILWWQLFPAHNISLLAVQLYGVRHKLFWLYALTGLKCLFEHVEVLCCSLILLLPNVVSSEGLFRYGTSIGLFQKKNRGRGLRKYFFHFFTLSLKIPEKAKLHPWKFHKIVLGPSEIPRAKPRTLEIPHYFLINPWNFHVLNPPPPHPPLLFFFFFLE